MTTHQVRVALAAAERPVLILGHGIRLAGAVERIDPLLDHLGVPALTSWAGLDMTAHPLVYGHCGLYGGRAANAIVQQADLVLAIGTRLAIPQIGYDLAQFAPGARIIVVDIDRTEATKYDRFEPVVMDAGDCINALLDSSWWNPRPLAWRLTCDGLREEYAHEPAWNDSPHFLSPYRFMERLVPHLTRDQVIVTDSGTALLCAHQALRLRPPQRLITTTGLGEMGFGLPAAIGASFARNKGEVLCLNTDGGAMMNVQEFQTIVHHQLPIKTIIFANDGYAMIKQTQKTLGHVRSGVDRASGLSCPNYTYLARGFGIATEHIDTWKDFNDIIPWMQSLDVPVVVEVAIDPEQIFAPKVATIKREDGILVSPPLDVMSPVLVSA